MKRNKALLLCGIGIIGLSFSMLYGFSVSPIVRLSSNRGDNIDLSYVKAEVKGDSTDIYVNYQSYGEFFEIAQDITVSTDKDSINALKQLNCVIEDGQYKYTFENNISPDTLYITPPVLYVPQSIEAYSAPLSGQPKKSLNSGPEWFVVESSHIEPGDNINKYMVSITIKPNIDMLPRLPKLILDGQAYGGLSTLLFNEDTEFESGEFVFYVEASDYDTLNLQLQEARLDVNNALIKVTASDAIFSTPSRALTLIKD